MKYEIGKNYYFTLPDDDRYAGYLCQGILLKHNTINNVLDFDVIWSYDGHIQGCKQVNIKNIIPDKYYWQALNNERERAIKQRVGAITTLKDLLEYPLSDEFESSDTSREVYKRALKRITGYNFDEGSETE